MKITGIVVSSIWKYMIRVDSNDWLMQPSCFYFYIPWEYKQEFYIF